MRKFIYTTSFFLLPVIVLAVITEVILRKIPNDYSYKKEYLDKHSNNIEILFLGNSHVFYGINPEFIKENSFNGAHVSQSLDYDLAILKKYEQKLNSLKYIIIPIDYFSLYTKLSDGVENWRVKNYNIYYGIHSNKFTDNFEIFSGEMKNNILRIKKFLKQEDDINCNKLGWGDDYLSSIKKDLEKTGKTAVLRHSKDNSSKKIFLENLETISQMIKFAEQKKIKIIFITCPAYKSYTDYLDKNQLNTIIETMTKLAKDHSSNIKYYNLLRNPNLDEFDFYDADHLNEIGAHKFSKEIDKLINK